MVLGPWLQRTSSERRGILGSRVYYVGPVWPSDLYLPFQLPTPVNVRLLFDPHD